MRFQLHKLSITILALILLTFSVGFKGCNQTSNNPQPSLTQRVVRSVSAIPSIVRVVAPNADTSLIEAAVNGFNAFVNDPNSDTWHKALNAWNDSAKPELSRLHNAKLNQIVAVVDILLSQVVVPEMPANSKAMPASPRIEFQEKDVKKLEGLVK